MPPTDRPVPRRARPSRTSAAPSSLLRKMARGLLFGWVLILPWWGGKIEVWWGLPLLGCAWAVFLLALVTFAQRREMRWLPSPMLLPLLLFVGWTGVSTLLGVQLRAGLLETERLLLAAFWLLALWWLAEPTDAAHLLLLTAVAGLAVAARGWWEYGTTLRTFGDPSWRIFAGFFTPTVTASYLTLAWAPLVALAISPPLDSPWLARWRDRPQAVGWLRVVCAGGATLVLGALLLTGARGGVLAVVGSGLTWAGLGLRHALAGRRATSLGGAGRRWWGAGVAVIAVVAGVVAVSPVGQRLFRDGLVDHSVMFRLLTWEAAARMAADRPLTGFGPGSFVAVVSRFSEAGFTRMAHNTPLQIAAEQGVPGLLLWLWWWGAVLALMGRTQTADRPPSERTLGDALIACWVAFLLHQLVDYGWYFTAVSGSAYALAGSAALLARSSARPVITMPRRWRWHPAATLLLGVLASLPLMDVYRASQAALKVEDARQLGRQGAIQSGLARLQEAARWDPWDPDSRRLLASWLAARGRFAGEAADLQRAETWWSQAWRLDPENPRTYSVGSRIAELAGNHYLAFDRSREALRRAPHDTRLWMDHAELALALQRKPLAAQAWQRVLDIARGPVSRYNPLPDYVFDPNFGEAALRLAQLADQEGRKAEAMAYYAQAVQYLQQSLQRSQHAQSILNASGQESEHTPERLQELLARAQAGLRQ